MKLSSFEAKAIVEFLSTTHDHLDQLNLLQATLPKTTLELLIAINKRGLDSKEAGLMASYLHHSVAVWQLQNIAAFDENTSHIIGREWHEIDYSGENMTWEKQKIEYAKHGVEHFKSLLCLKKFFLVESRLPYFSKIYKPTTFVLAPRA